MEIKKIPSIFPGEYSIECLLEDGLKHILGPFTDDKKAIKAVKEFELREYGESVKDENHKKLSPFDYINSFYNGINPFDKMDQGQMDLNLKAYSQFMIERGLSMSEENAIAVSQISKLNLDNYAHAAYFAGATVRPKKFAKWIKEEKKNKKLQNKIEEIKKEYECSELMAEVYLEVLNAINK